MSDASTSAGLRASLATADERKGAQSLQPLRQLAPFVLRYPLRLGLTLAFLLIAALASLAIPLLAGRIIDVGFIERNIEALGTYSLLAIGVALIMAVATGARFYFISVLGERVVTDLRKAVFNHLLELDTTFYDTHRVGELTSRLTGDVTTIRDAIGSSLSMTLRSLIIIIGAVILMFVTSWWLALAVIVVTPLTVLPVIFLARRLRKMSRRTQDALAEMSAMATEALGASKTIKSFTQEPHQAAAYATRAENSFKTASPASWP